MEDDLLGTLFAKRFHIESLLGSGGMGSVYLARHEVLHRLFALKVIRTDMLSDQTIAARFRREARAASRVEHPNIIQIADFGQDEDGRLYLAMEYVEGPTLADVIREEGAFPVARALGLLEQIVDAMRAAHASNVIHRDLKPINILIATAAAKPDHVKILDFGLAKILDPFATAGLSAHGQLFGTPEYMSPERCMDAPADHRSDIYSQGIIAFELLAGKVPFRGRVVQTLSAHLSQPAPRPSEASGRNDIPAALDEIVLRCLAKKPEDRFQSADELLASLRALWEDPVLAAGLAGTRERSRPAELFETLPPDYLVEEPEADVHDTVVVRRSAEGAESPALSQFLQALEQLAYALRDRGVGDVEVTCRLSLLLETRDRQLQARSALQLQQRQVEELRMTARIRESRLGQVLHQLNHELDRADPDETRVLQGRIDSVTARIQEIADERAGQEAEIQACSAQLGRQLEALTGHVRGLAEDLRALLRPLLGAGLSGDPEIQRLAAEAQI